MKRFIFLISIFVSLVCTAQKLKVTSFNIQPQDLTGRDQPRVDHDGQLPALLKICVMDKITNAEGTVLGDIVSHGIEKWVYVTDNTKKIRLHFENHFPLMIVFDDYNYPSAQEKMVYEVILEEENGQPAVAPSVASTPTPSTVSTPVPTTPVVTPPTPSTAEILAEAKKYYDERNYTKAMELFKKIDGDKEAQFYIGYMYYVGEGVSKDFQEAVRWYRKAAEQGDAKAQCNLGTKYYNGEGVAKDYQEAIKWYRKAAEQGLAKAQANLGDMYYFGEGVSKDFQEAIRWWRKAAEQGNANAQFNLGKRYYFGEGVSKDVQEAIRWYRKAAEQGNANAQFNLGLIYNLGLGVPMDIQEAVKWFRKAAEQGHKLAKERLKELGY